PSLSRAMVALALAAFATRERASPAWAVGSGAVIAFAVLTKFLALPFLFPVLALPLAARRGKRSLPWIVAGGCAAVLIVALVHLGSLQGLWRGAVTDREGAKNLSHAHDNVLRLRWLPGWRTPFGGIGPAGRAGGGGGGGGAGRWGRWGGAQRSSRSTSAPCPTTSGA